MRPRSTLQKRGTIVEKGIVNNKVSERMFVSEDGGVPTHFVQRLSDREMLTKRVTIVPVEVVVRNRVAGSLAKRLGLKDLGHHRSADYGVLLQERRPGRSVNHRDHIRLLKLAEPHLWRRSSTGR